jgi:hypothetical protein
VLVLIPFRDVFIFDGGDRIKSPVLLICRNEFIDFLDGEVGQEETASVLFLKVVRDGPF